ncbi:MAG TPA: sigma-70 family RNA polymerase sigma factor [Candidatus Atribacteria bacterium]|nr:sigma-70 family RNA polymerase sigma factor [Candidatus Atribacteria bacterium]HQE24982.1 sigma-70 family RNA polymerase sigma factor [Candidatus Atribacteria bacterium]
MYEEKSDGELVTEVLNGNDDLFYFLIRRYEKPIFNYIYRLVKHREEAEDLAQETFTKAFFALHQYNHTYEFSTWIFRIALNVCRDHFRRKKFLFFSLNTPVGEEEETEWGDLIEQNSFLDPDGELSNQELREELEKAIDHLPLKFKEVIILRHLEGLSYNDISRITNLPVGTVKTYLHRARKKLREELKDYLD